ncbi:MAG: ATP-binding protein [Methanoregula sp.]|uniref:ATP-binding protein n=1 Tax=Methanoregula sp. TaxID=2052170 RepID=UPI003BB20427
MKFDEACIGSGLMEAITVGLYGNNLNCLREYIQNGIDEDAKNIELFFENGDQDFVIKDDGNGMNRTKLISALSIGISEKTEPDIGWRGIGIWSGVPVSKKIVIITKSRNKPILKIEIDNDVIRKEIPLKKPLLDVLTKATTDIEELKPGKDDSLANSHYTIIRLESILHTQKSIFVKKEIKKYLARVIPIPFNEETFLFAPEINKLLKDSNVKFPLVNVTFQGEKIFRFPERSDIFFEKISKKEFKIEGEVVAIGWFITHKENGVLKDPNGGIIFKKKGFTIGDKHLVHKQFEGHYAQWQYGEIHIISNELKEDTARNNFENTSPKLDPFLEDVGAFVGQLHLQNQYQSARVVTKDLARTQKYIEKEDFSSAKEKIKEITGRLAERRSYPGDDSLKEMKSVLDSESTQNKEELTEIKKELVGQTPSLKEAKISHRESTIMSLPKPVRDHIPKTRKKGKLDLQSSLTDSIRDKLKEQTASSSNEIHELTREAFGWDIIKASNKPPLLTIDPTYNNQNQQDSRCRVPQLMSDLLTEFMSA